MNAKLSFLEIPSKFGTPAKYVHREHPEGSRNLAVMFPGQAYSNEAPLMWYSSLAAFEAGFDVLSVEYGFQSSRTPAGGAGMGTIIREVADALSDFTRRNSYERFAFIAKSIGTDISMTVETQLRLNVEDHVFLTPLRDTIPFIQKSKRILVLVGENDPLFDSKGIKQISGLPNAHVMTYPKADHLLEVQADFAKSLEILQSVATEVHKFLRGER